MKKLSDVSWSPYKLAIIGEHGSGKTRLASTAPGRQRWFCFEQGLMSIAHIQGCRERVDFEDYPIAGHNFPIYGQSMDRAMRDLKGLFMGCPYEVVVVDSLLSLTEVALEWALQQEGKAGQPPSGYSVWGKLGTVGNQFLSGFLNLPCSKILICHEAYDKDEVDGHMEYKMATKGNMIAQDLPKHFDEIWRMLVTPGKDGKGIYKVQTSGGMKFKAKSRWDCFETLEEPNVEVLLRKVIKKFPPPVTAPSAAVNGA